jgi:hypothetical protein
MRDHIHATLKISLVILFCGMAAYLRAEPSTLDSCSHNNTAKIVEWELQRILQSPPEGWSVLGEPKIIDSPYGKAMQFDGQKDALVFDANPLVNLRHFTIEVVMRPDTNGSPEQRFLHFGEVRGERVMVETRLTRDSQWYLDTYMKSGQTGQTLADTTILHPLNLWYHVAFVADDGKIETYVNGRKELEGQIPFSPFTLGQTSIGVRLNRVNWYKGSIYKIRITPAALAPNAFMK